MIIKKLNLNNYRNHLKLDLDFSEGINVIFGDNGSGKTNIVESIYFTSYLKSFRTSNDREIIKFNEQFAKITITTTKLHEVIVTKTSKKCMLGSNIYKKQSEYIGILKSVLFSPETIDLLLKSPSERRKYLDMLICMVDSSYIYVIKEFNYILKQRNEYLKQVQSKKSVDTNYLSVLDLRFIEISAIIYKKRDETVKHLNQYARDIFKLFFDYDFEIQYEIQSELDINDIRESFKRRLNSRYEREILMGATLSGPSKDDIIFYMNGNNSKYFASKGQQRISLIALKLAEVELIRYYCDEMPILILDDVLSELDIARQTTLFNVLFDKKIQTIITTTDINDIELTNNFNKIDISMLRNNDNN